MAKRIGCGTAVVIGGVAAFAAICASILFPGKVQKAPTHAKNHVTIPHTHHPVAAPLDPLRNSPNAHLERGVILDDCTVERGTAVHVGPDKGKHGFTLPDNICPQRHNRHIWAPVEMSPNNSTNAPDHKTAPHPQHPATGRTMLVRFNGKPVSTNILAI